MEAKTDKQTHRPAFGSSKSGTSLEALFEGWEQRSTLECLDECNRELGVRERIYEDWVEKGKLSETDAKLRIQSMCKTCMILSLINTSGALETLLEESTRDHNAGETQL